MAAVLAALAVPASDATSQPAESRRAVPAELRRALLGCWELESGDTYVIETLGAHGLHARWETREGERHQASMFYVPTTDSVRADCGARTQHGQVCVFEPTETGALRVTSVSRRSGRGTSMAAQPCGRDVAPPAARSPVVHAIPLDAPAADLLLRRRRDVDATRTPTAEDAGWTRYGDALAVRFEHGLVMRVRVRLAATSCEEAAVAAGYPQREGSTALRRTTGCEWPGISARHRLAAHVAGRWTAADAVMELWQTP